MNRIGKRAALFACLATLAPLAAPAAGTLPAGYTEIEYIQGPGNGRFVTDYTPQPNTDKIEAVVEWPSGTLANNVNHAVWCARGNGTQADSWTLFDLGTQFRFDYMPNGHAVSLTPSFTISTGTKYTITAEDNTVTYSANGSVLQTQSTPAYSYTAGSVLALFASHYSGINANVGNYGKHKLYSFKVWRSGNLIHYFVPCKDANGVATLVDICNNPATLAKSGTFTAGQEGHYYDDLLFPSDDALVVAGYPGQYGSPSPAYGIHSGLSAGETVAVSCATYTNTTLMIEYTCTGWKLLDADGAVISNGTEKVFTYTHPTPAATRTIAWQWTARPMSTISDTTLPVSGAAFHVDASMPSTIDTIESGGKQLVTAWRDASGGSMRATCGTASRPRLVTDDGLPYVDFGPQTSGNASSANDNAGALVWSSELTTVREVFLVFSDYPGSQHSFFFGASGTYHFHRNQKKLFNNQYASANVKNGLKEVDGVECTIDYELPEGFHIIHLRTTGNVTAGRFAWDRNVNYGGQRLQEVVVYTKTLTDAEAGSVYDYLYGKWFAVPDMLEIDAFPEQFGSPIPEYGIHLGFAPGETSTVSCGVETVTDTSGTVYACAGWTLYDQDDKVVSNGKETSFTYVHPTPAAYRKLKWQWVEPLTILPIPDQIYNFGDICRPELTVSNIVNGATWTIGGDSVSADFDVVYENNIGAGVASVTVTGKGTHTGERASATFNISATALEDANLSTTDPSARRIEVGGKYVYIFTNAASAASVSVKRNLVLTDALLVGGGGAGGNTMAGGGGAGGFLELDGVYAEYEAGDTIAFTVGAGGAVATGQNRGGNGGDTVLTIGGTTHTAKGGGGGGGWGSAVGASGGSGGGSTRGGSAGLGVEGQGHAGARAASGATSSTGGGGGAGESGHGPTTSPARSGDGGAGRLFAITGEYYGGGGGGGGSVLEYGTALAGSGGLGGGGDGGRDTGGANGVDGLGGGGGGGGWTGANQSGGKGGCGTVILVFRQTELSVNPIPGQSLDDGGVCRPEFTIVNTRTAQSWTLGGDSVSPDFDVEYTNNTAIGVAGVTIAGKGDYADERFYTTFRITSDVNISTDDLTVRTITTGGRKVYVFKNAALGSTTVTIRRGLFLTDALLVGGGGAGGNTMGAGGGGGGVLELNGVNAIYAPDDTIHLAVGAGGVISATAGQRGSSGGKTTLDFGAASGAGAASVTGGGAGGAWGTNTGLNGASGGGGCKTAAGGAGTEGLGYAGAAGSGDGKSGGGGGAGHAGYAADTTALRAGNGGEGVTSDITGEVVYYGGGGAAGGSDGGYNNYDPGIGGLGGGGGGGKSLHGENGVDGFGGGGGGAGYNGVIAANGGNGGAGTVILAFTAADLAIDPIPSQVLVAGGACPDPVVRLYGSQAVLTKDVDYTVSYTGNDAFGTAQMTVTGIGTYAGKVGYAKFLVVDHYYYVKPEVAEEGDGLSWATAMSVTNFFTTFQKIDTPCEVWIAAGTVSAPAFLVTNNAPLVIRGGFAGTETTLDERQPGALTIFDGKVGNTRTSSILLSVENAAGADLVLERLKFCNAKSNGFVKTGGGSLTVLDCVVEANGRDTGKVYGRGMNAQGGGSGSLVVANCVFAGNRCISGDTQYGGFGLYASSFASAVVEDSLFVTNGYDLAVEPGKSYAGYLKARGSAIYAENTPITVRGCRFAGNSCPIRKSGDDWCGGTIALEGACGGSVIENCALIGNTEYRSADENYGAYCGGAIAVRLSNIATKAKVRNCTIAYNITHSSNSGGGITVARGEVDVENSIIWRNGRYRYTVVGFGSDVQVQTDGRANIRNSLVTTLDGTALVGANLTVDEDTVFAVDPQLVTSTATFESLLTVTDSYQYYTYTNPTIYEDLAAMDAHLLSAAGYCVNGGEAGPATSITSTAIDMGDPDADCANEPAPNGGRLNLGAYGNTVEASRSVTGQPEANVEVTFPDGLTRPVVRVTMGLESGTGYSATVRLTCLKDGAVIDINDYTFVANGDVIEWKSPEFLEPGAIFKVVVAITASGASPVAYNSETQATGEFPPYYGKGGGPNVIHVREGADCKMDGTSWTDAFPDIKTALASIQDDSKTEMWLSVTNDHLNESTAIAYPLTIRGGFAGVENSPDERPEGSRSILDGREAFESLVINNTAAVSIERIVFIRGLNCGLIKSGAGDLRVSDCHFLTNGMGRATNTSGKGARVSGATATTVVTFTNCVFRCNRAKPGSDGGCGAYGAGINASKLKCLRLEECTFVHNGIHLRAPGGGSSYEPSAGNTYGTAIYSTAPVSAVGCRFAANFGTVRNNYSDTRDDGFGGTVRLQAGAEGSAFTNCAWVANGEEIVWQNYGTGGKNIAGPLTVQFASKEGTVDVNNCTFAYNLTDGYEVTGGLNLILGTANVRNSIFYGNIIGGASKSRGRDISLRGESILNVAYTLFGEEGTNSITCAATATTNFLDGVVFGDPLLVTSTEVVAALVKESTATAVGGSKLIFWDWTAATQPAVYAALEATDVHLRSYGGTWKGGEYITYPKQLSPAIDAGDRRGDYAREPEVPGFGGNGHRVNLGAYGNTPEASLSPFRGSVFIVR